MVNYALFVQWITSIYFYTPNWSLCFVLHLKKRKWQIHAKTHQSHFPRRRTLDICDSYIQGELTWLRSSIKLQDGESSKERIMPTIACERQTFLLAYRRWGTFREEKRLRLSERNSILMTQNLSGIRSEALIGRRSSFIVLAIVYEWQTKDKRPQRSNVNAMNL